MSRESLHILLDRPSLKRAKNGAFNFFNRLSAILEARGWDVVLDENSPEKREAAARRGGPTLVHMDEPTHPGALTCRRAYLGAFWRIETTHKRWDWPIAKAQFDRTAVDGPAASRFFENWRKWQYDRGMGVGDDDFVLVPLQGRLLGQRSFQSMSPIAMLEELLARTDLPILATLHPRETYSVEETSALDALCEKAPRLEVESGVSELMLRRCSYVVTQNSAMAFHGYFLGKRAVLFGEIDFHHIAGSVPRDGLDGAFERLKEQPDFARYLYWFLTSDALNAGNAEFDHSLPEKLRNHGWPI